MSSQFIEKQYIKSNTIDKREYQVNIADSIKSQNSIVVLPTGLGKTVIALLSMAESMINTPTKTCMILAPTRVLVHQHYEFLLNSLNLSETEISVITGEDTLKKRQTKWQNQIVCATPQILQLDINRGIIDLEQFSIVIFDEVHRAVGEYAYVPVAQSLYSKNSEIIMHGMTASLPSELPKIEEIMNNIHVTHIESRDRESEDVKPYIHDTKIEKIEIELTDDIKTISNLIKKTISSYSLKLRSNGQLLPRDPSLKAVLAKSHHIEKDPYLSKRWDIRSNLYSLVRLLHGINIIETQGVDSFSKYVSRLKSKQKSSGVKKLLEHPDFSQAIILTDRLQSLGEDHPKLAKLESIMEANLRGTDKAIIFASYRDTVNKIFEVLHGKGYHVGILIGKSGQTGQSQKQQLESLEKLKSGEFDILVATQVGEEGLDVSECKLVVFYDNVSSAIRFTQRLGRTGRRSPGKVVSFITKGTRDETNYYISQQKLSKSQRTIKRMNKNYKKPTEKKGLDKFL